MSMVTRRHPTPLGEHALGTLRTRLPPVEGSSEPGLLAQIFYPAQANALAEGVAPIPLYRSEVIDELAKLYKLPGWLIGPVLKGNRQLDVSLVPKAPEEGKWPIVVFSSGLFGSCDMYSQLCRELASFGAIVIAIEHEDGSGCYATDAKTGEVIKYNKPPENVNHKVFRHPFLEKRADELESLTTTLQQMAASDEAPSGSSEAKLLASVLQLGDAERLVITGHSFGAAGIVRYLTRLDENDRPCPWRGALFLDLWGEPLVEKDTTRRLQTPFVAIVCEDFLRGGIPTMRKIATASGDQCLGMIGIPGTKHQWVSESTYLLPAWILRKIGLLGLGHVQQAHENTMLVASTAVKAFLKQRSFMDNIPRNVFKSVEVVGPHA